MHNISVVLKISLEGAIMKKSLKYLLGGSERMIIFLTGPETELNVLQLQLQGTFKGKRSLFFSQLVKNSNFW